MREICKGETKSVITILKAQNTHNDAEEQFPSMDETVGEGAGKECPQSTSFFGFAPNVI